MIVTDDTCEFVDLEQVMARINETRHREAVTAVRLSENGDLELDTAFSTSRDIPPEITDAARQVRGLAGGKKVIILTEDGTSKEMEPDN